MRNALLSVVNVNLRNLTNESVISRRSRYETAFGLRNACFACYEIATLRKQKLRVTFNVVTRSLMF